MSKKFDVRTYVKGELKNKTNVKEEPKNKTKFDVRTYVKERQSGADYSSAPSSSKSDTTKKNTVFDTETANAYTTAKSKLNTTTTIPSNLTDDERQKRIKEIKSELGDIAARLPGYGRAKVYGSSKYLEEAEENDKARQAELKKELQDLERAGAVTGVDMLQWEIEDAKKKVSGIQQQVDAFGKRPSADDAEKWRETSSKLNNAKNELDTLEREKTLYDDISKFGDVVHNDNHKEEGFWEFLNNPNPLETGWLKNFESQWRANYRYADLTRDADKAMSIYLSNPTEENKQIAYAYDALAKEYAKNNEKALDDEGVVASWLTKSAAGYLPQFKDQILPEVIGGAAGTVVGAVVGAPNIGAGVGAGIATFPQMYEVMKGSVYRTLLAEGVDEQTASEAAEDEALISSLIESGGTAVGWMFAGGGKALQAIGSAAIKSVAKGSTNVATKYVAQKFLNITAKMASQPAWTTAVKVAGGIVGNALTEYGEEFAQQGVSIANKERALNGADEGLISGSYNVIKDALTGIKPEARAEMHEAGKEGFKIGLMFGGTSTVVNNAVSRYFNAKTIKEQNEILDFTRNDKETLDALIEEAKASGKGTVSEKIATEIEAARESGKEVTRDQVKRLIASNDVYINNEEQTAEMHEQETRDIVKGRNIESGTPINERLEALTQANEPLAIEDVKKASGFGDSGAKLLTEIASEDGMTFIKARDEMKVAYFSGYAGEDITFTNDLQNRAKLAGIDDRIVANNIAKENAKKATIYKGAFTEGEYTKNWSDATKKMVSTVAKHFGMDISAVDKIIASTTIENGVEIEHEANASHDDGKMVISSTAEKLIHSLVLHESGHRMEQMATDEWNELANYLYKRAEKLGRRAKLGFSRGMAFDTVKAEHDEAGLTKTTSDYINEIAVQELETIFSSAEEFNNFIAEIESNPQAKSGLQKVIDFIKEVFEEIKRIFTGTKEEKELERIKELYSKAYLATKDAVAERRNTQSQGVAENVTTEGDMNFSLKMVDGKSVVWIEKSGLTKKQLNSHSVVENYIEQHIGEFYTIIESGQKVYIGEDLPQEYTHSENTTGLRKHNMTAARGKNKAVDGFGELIETATNRRWEKTRHTHNKDAKYGMYRYDNSFAFPVRDNKGVITNIRAYDVELLIRNASDGKKYLYDVKIIKENTTTEIGLLERMTRMPDKSQATRDSVYDDRVPQNPKSVKTDFSLKEKAPTFYSQMGKTIADMKQDKIGANSVVSYLKGRGVKDEEIKWSGVETFLEGKKSVTKAELQEFVAGSMLQIEENVLSDEEASNYKIDYTDFERNQLNSFEENLTESWGEIDTLWEEMFGEEIAWDIRYNDNAPRLVKRELNKRVGDNKDSRYEQITSSLKDVELWESQRDQIVSIAKERTKEVVAPKWGEYKLEGGDNYREILFKIPDSTYSNSAMSTHWGNTRGVLAHARIQDFDVDSGKMLFVEEIQSDWHNEGQREGYANKLSPAKEKAVADLREKQKQKHNELKEVLDAMDDISANSDLWDKATKLRKDEQAIWAEIKRLQGRGNTPDAPFKDNYHEYVLKRLIRMAAEEGYSSIGWTTADIQNERWSEQYAEGYRIEYDQDIPKFLNKYGKKWGAKVGKTTLGDVGVTEYTLSLEEGEVGDGAVYRSEEEAIAGLVEYVNNNWGTDYDVDNAVVANSYDNGLTIEDEMSGDEIGFINVNEAGGSATVWSMPITDSMKASVLYEGQPQYSLKDSDYLKAVESGDIETAQKMVDEVAKANGYNIRAYHGTSRGDRVGNVFLPERATSGPMAFFTDNKEIAEGYSKAKPDTSMAYDPDYDSYETQFRIKIKDRDIPLYRAWGYLPFDARNRITQKAQQLREDWDGDNEFILDPNNKEANGGFQWQMKEARGNTLLALNEQWLNSGTLFNEENRFLEVLEMAGVMEEFKKIGEIYFKDPKARHEKVYDTYLRITTPFDTSLADNSFVDGLLAWYEEQDQTQYERESMESDLWDKNSIDAYEFADRVRSDIENETFHAWTSIPDSVTDYLKSLGYDGIKDLGGKNSDVGHTVWIPFSSEQIKSSEPVTYDDKGNVIPLSQRFNKENVDIRYSLKDIKDKYADKTDHLYIYEKKNTISIDNMVVKKGYRNQGVGTAILNDVIDYADRVQKTITLTPTSEFGTKERLKKWYKANGFVENKGRNTDFTISDTMYRLPSGKSYSLKGTSNINTKDQKELLDIIEHLKGEFEVTKFAKADPKKLSKLTKDILKEYNSKADFDETYKAIDELYQYMANGEDGHTAVWEDVYSRAYNVAQGIVENSLVTDDYMYQQYKSLRDYLRGTPIKFDPRHDSVPSSYENFNEFRKMNMGRLKFTNNGMSIDYIYQELAHLYPEFFNAEEQVTSEEQFETIIDVLDQIQPTEINPFDRQIEQVSMQLANDLTSRFFDIPQAKPTFADKAERRVVEAHIKGGKKVEAVRQQKNERIKKLLEAQREKTKKQLDKIREQRDTKVKKEQAKRRDAISKMSETQKAKVLRARITRHASDLSKKLVNPTDNQHIPYELQGVVAKLLDCINLESNYTYDTESHSYKKNDEGLPSKRTQAFYELRDIYKNIASSVVVDPDLVVEGGLLSSVISLADKRIVDMNSSELETVWQTMRAIEASVSTANKMFSQGKFATILEYAEALREDNAGKKEKTELKGVIGKSKKLAMLDMLTPETYFHFLGSAGDSIFRMMRDAQDKHISIMKEVADFAHKALDGVDVNSLEKTVHTVKLGGEEVQLTTAQLMELYVLMKREQAVDHIMIGGILPDTTEGKGLKLNTKAEPIRNLTIVDITRALSKLTDEQKKIADKLQNFVSTVLSGYGNEASMKVYNYEKFLEKNYWTIRTNKQEIASEIGKDTAVTSVANKGMAKGTVPHANTSVRIGSIFDTFASHSSDMATYAAWLGTSEDVNRIRNFVFWDNGTRTGTVKGILDTVHGIHGSEYLQKLLTDIAIGVKGTDNMNPFDKLIGHYKAASVGANLRVIIQQPTAILRAMDMIGAHYLAEGAINPLKGWEKAKKYAPIAQWKDWGHFDINTGRQMKDVLFDNASLLEKTKQVGMWGASMADSLAWGQLWNAVEAETKAKHKELEVGSDAYYETVAKRFTEIIDHTQVVDGILQRSQIMRSPDALTKMATSFMGEPTKQYNMAVSAAYDAINGKGDTRKKAVARLGRTAMSLAVAGIVNACAQSIIDAMRDDDKEKDYWEKWQTAFVGDGEDTKFINSNLADTINPLNYVPFAKDVVSILQGYDVKRMDTESITKTFNAITNMYKAVTGTGKYTVAEASAQLFAETTRLFGLPVANFKRDVKSLVMAIANATDSYLLQYRIEKGMLNINYAGNSKNFMDILFNAYKHDKAAYSIIYKDLLKNGYEAEKLDGGIEARMNKADGGEKKYKSSLNKVKSSTLWKSATPTQRKNAETDLRNFLTSTSEDMGDIRAEAEKFGIDETEYTLWQLAKEMASDGKDGTNAKEKAAAMKLLNMSSDDEWGLYLLNNESKGAAYAYEMGIDSDTYAEFIEALYKYDKPSKSGKYGTFSQDEATNAVNSLGGLTRQEKAILWQSVNTTWKKNPF